jgi:hypothetical protein
MILFLILASLAAVYYISPMAEAERRPTTKEAANPEAAGVLTPGLVALGRALDQYGRGRQPPPAGLGVGEEVRKTERDRL